MEKVEICTDFMNWKTLKIGDKIIQSLEVAIDIVRASKISNVQLRHIAPSGSIDEWDNF